ncbi:MAG: 7TM diverse intracellular signaling domain-containing protein, partial [Bacteroidota bacterium]
IRNRAYIYYILYLAFVGFFYAMLTGYAQMFVYPNTPQFNNFLVTVLALGCIFILAFSAYHLNLKEVSKRNYWVVLGLIAISTIMGILELFIDSVALISLSQVFSLLMSLYLLGLGVYLWIFQKQRQASLYVIAWSAYLVGIILLILSKNLVVPSNFFTNHMIFIGSAMEVILFSIALADRYRVIKQEREDAIAKALSLEKTNAQILEDKVARRTEQLLKANTKLETAFKTVSDQKHDIEEGIYYARKIQRAMLPRQESIKKAFPEHFIFFKPREIVSGDFYFFAQKEEDYFLAAADCTGHGVPGGLMSMIGNDLLHQSLQSGLRQPEKIIEFLGAGIRRILYQDSSDNEDSMTIALVRINQREKKLWFSGAKQGLLVFQDGESKYLEGTAHELGAADKETDYQYEAHEVSFVEPTTIFLGSDGLQDQIGKETGEALGHKKVIEFLEETSHFPIKIQYNQIESFVDQWMHDTPQTDDILLWRIDL